MYKIYFSQVHALVHYRILPNLNYLQVQNKLYN